MELSYTGRLSKAHLTEIDAYLTSGDRDDPLVFQGRQEVLSTIRKQIQYPRPRQKTLTHVITGVPGVGKTALLNEIAKREHDTANVVIIDSLNLRTKRAFIDVCAYALDLKVDNEDLDNVTQTTRKGADKVLFYGRESAVEKIPSIETELGHWEILAKLLKNSKQHLILCIDEVQNTPDTPFAQSLITQLHISQTGELRVIPVFSGLLNSLEVLAKRGVSRVSRNDTQLRALSEADSRAIVRQTLSHSDLGLNGANGFSMTDLSMLGKLLSQASENWPRHLDGYTKGVLSCILDDQSKSSPTQTIDLSHALEIGHRDRVADYERMFKSTSEPETKKLARHLGSIFKSESTLTLDDIQTKAISRSVAFKDEAVFDTAFNECIRKGFIEDAEGKLNYYGIPIPSLSTYLRNGMDREATLKELRAECDQYLDTLSQER